MCQTHLVKSDVLIVKYVMHRCCIYDTALWILHIIGTFLFHSLIYLEVLDYSEVSGNPENQEEQQQKAFQLLSGLYVLMAAELQLRL